LSLLRSHFLHPSHGSWCGWQDHSSYCPLTSYFAVIDRQEGTKVPSNLTINSFFFFCWFLMTFTYIEGGLVNYVQEMIYCYLSAL
jgi:hypothetical protein